MGGSLRRLFRGSRVTLQAGALALLLTSTAGSAPQTSPPAPAARPAPSSTSAPSAMPAPVATPAPPDASPILGTGILTLEDAVRLAVRRNLDVRAARYRPGIGQARVDQERAAFLPSLDVEAYGTGYSKDLGFLYSTQIGSETDRGASVGLRAKTPSGVSYGLQYQLLGQDINLGPDNGGLFSVERNNLVLHVAAPLLKGAGADYNLAPLRIARNKRKTEALVLEQRALDVAAAVERAYWTVLSAGQVLDLRHNAQNRARQFLADLREAVREGTRAPYETIESEQKVASRTADMAEAEKDLDLAQQQLRSMLRLPVAGPPLTLAEPPALARPTDLGELTREAGERRPELARAHLAVENAATQKRADRNGLQPAVDVTGDLKLTGGTQNLYLWRLGVRCEVPLPNLEGQSRYVASTLQEKQERELRDAVAQQIDLEVAQAARAVEMNARRLESTHQASVRARERVEMEFLRFRSGLSTSHDVIFFEDALIDAQMTEAAAALSLRNAEVDLDRARAVTLSNYHIRVTAEPVE